MFRSIAFLNLQFFECGQSDGTFSESILFLAEKELTDSKATGKWF